MKKVFRRILSTIMAASIVISQMPMGEVFAEEMDKAQKVVEQEEKNSELDSGEIQGTDNSESGEGTEVITTDSVYENDEEAISSDTEQSQKGGEDVLEQESEEASIISETAATTLLNYVFVEKPYVTTPDAQNIMVSVGEDATVLERAILKYRNVETGEAKETSATIISGNSALFTLEYQEQESAVYQLTSVTYSVDGKEYTDNFTELGMDIKYGVNQEADVAPDDVLVNEEDVSEVEANIVTTDEEGMVLSEQDIQQAIENSESSVPSTQALDETLSSARRSSNGNLVVVLDPGHDSTHAGTHQNGCAEEDMVLKIAQYCKEELQKYSGVTVYMTREGQGCPNGGSSVSAADCNAARVEFAASKGANVYVSFHLNSSSNSSANGAGIYYPNSNYRPDLGEQGHGLAQKILEKLNAVGLGTWAGGTLIRNSEDNTTYPDGSLADYLGVIRRCKLKGIPAVLIEHAFVTNGSDKNNFLISDEKLKKLGVADAQAIAEYYGLNITSTTYYNGIDYKDVYDYDYYINTYPDMKGAYGNDAAGALKHFVDHGMSEGRQGSAEFDVKSYKNQYADLRAAYGNDLKSYYMHYVLYGKAEGRKGTGCAGLQGAITIYKGVDYSAVYDYNYYINHYTDMKNAYSNDDVGALEHFVLNGMKEGRQGNASFDVRSYRNQYQDLRGSYGKNLTQYYLHYIQHGKAEGRKATGVSTIQNPLTVYKGVDYSAVYDYNYYISHYADMKRDYADDDIGAITHFVEFGMSEGRQGNASFDVRSYRNQYQDLRGSYGRNLSQYYLHYIQHGKAEGRKATGISTIQNPLTVYKGVDYSAVYDYNYYISHYADMKRDYADDDIGAITHFVEFGMSEGRQGNASFDVRSYRNQYQDLRGSYGRNLSQYYLHYIQHGKAEGRKATGVSTIQNPLTVYKGVDYSAVYDYNYYIGHYADMKRDYADDDIGAITHFVEFGMSEGRQGNAEFNVNYYRENYYDLSCGIGNDLPRYYLHYVTNGKAEGRIASELIQYAIMGNSNTSLSQMVAYYKANAVYPTFYANSDAPNIENFCQMYIEECAIEGVRPEVAFCQAMKETGFLRYGGDVKIEQYNFAGLGATGGGNPGNSFPSVRIGIRAQVQHLKAYASTEGLRQECVDPRFKYVTRGTAPYVEWLGIQENPFGMGWATAKDYGYSIKKDYIYKLIRY